MTLEELKKLSLTELKSVAFDLLSEKELITNSLNVVLEEIRLKSVPPRPPEKVSEKEKEKK